MEMEYIPLKGPDFSLCPKNFSKRIMDWIVWGPEGEKVAFEKFVSRKNV